MKYELFYNPDTRLLYNNYREITTEGDWNSVELHFIIPLVWINVSKWASDNNYTAYCVFDREHIIPLPYAEAQESIEGIIHIFGWDDAFYLIPYRDSTGYWIYNQSKRRCEFAWVETLEDAISELNSSGPPKTEVGWVEEIVDYPDIPDNPDEYPDEESDGIMIPHDLMNRPYVQLQLKFVSETETFYSYNILEVKINKAIR